MSQTLQPNADTQETLTFLRKWPSAFPHVVAININPRTHKKGLVEGRSFARADLDGEGRVERYVARRQGKASQYFAVNTLLAPMNSKPAKTNVDEVIALQIDLDVPENEDQEAGARKLLGVVRSYRLPPSAIISSGGGVQAFWILKPEDRIKIGGDETKAEAAECYTRGLEYEFRAMGVGKVDPCHNVDRIMRLPGTINVPDDKKIAKGRKVALAKLVEFSDVTYPLSAFTPAAPKPSTSKPGNSPAPIDWGAVDGEVPPEVLEKFNAERAARPVVAKLWEGLPAPSQADTTPSGFLFAFAGALKRSGKFTSTEYAQLHEVWDHKSVKHAGDRRAVQRAWDNNQGPNASGFEVVELPPLTETQEQQRQERRERQRKAQIEREAPEAGSNVVPFPVPPGILAATPFVWRDPKTIPRRQFLYGTHYIRQFVSSTIAPGGVGKSSLVSIEALAMATGRPLLGVRPEKRLRVWLWNGEDPKVETERRIAAACIHYGIAPAELDGWLFVDSGRDAKIVIAEANKDGAKIMRPVVDAVIATIRKNEIDVMTVDPFVSCHHVPENDNGGMDGVVKEWGGIADAANAAIELVHHSRKTNGAEVTVEDARGASAVVFATRDARAINTMTKQEAENAGVANRRLHFRCESGKANLAPPADKADWFQLVSVPLGNGDSATIDNGDKVAVVAPWQYPNMLAGVTSDLTEAAFAKIRAGECRENPQATEWVGKVVAEVMGFNLGKKHEKAKTLNLIKLWLDNGALAKVKRKDKNGDERLFVEVAHDG